MADIIAVCRYFIQETTSSFLSDFEIFFISIISLQHKEIISKFNMFISS